MAAKRKSNVKVTPEKGIAGGVTTTPVNVDKTTITKVDLYKR